jgi:hypothetical protein
MLLSCQQVLPLGPQRGQRDTGGSEIRGTSPLSLALQSEGKMVNFEMERPLFVLEATGRRSSRHGNEKCGG